MGSRVRLQSWVAAWRARDMSSDLQYEFDLDDRDDDGVTQKVLRRLQQGPADTNCLKQFGHRFSTRLDELRKQGWRIDNRHGEGRDCIYELVGKVEMVLVTTEMKEAYYLTEHWLRTRAERMAFDESRCCHCRSTEELQVHHWKYEIFCEEQCDLTTLCRPCHERLHKSGKLKLRFPKYVTPEHATLLGYRP